MEVKKYSLLGGTVEIETDGRNSLNAKKVKDSYDEIVEDSSAEMSENKRYTVGLTHKDIENIYVTLINEYVERMENRRCFGCF